MPPAKWRLANNGSSACRLHQLLQARFSFITELDRSGPIVSCCGSSLGNRLTGLAPATQIEMLIDPLNGLQRMSHQLRVIHLHQLTRRNQMT